MENQNKIRARGYGLMLLIFAIMCIGIKLLIGDSESCIRTLDGAVHCKCDFKDGDAWSDYKEQTKGTWEAVMVDNPCK